MITCSLILIIDDDSNLAVTEALNSVEPLGFDNICVFADNVTPELESTVRAALPPGMENLLLAHTDKLWDNVADFTDNEYLMFLATSDKLIDLSLDTDLKALITANDNAYAYFPAYKRIDSTGESGTYYELSCFQQGVLREQFINMELDKSLDNVLSGTIIPASVCSCRAIKLLGNNHNLNAKSLLIMPGISRIKQTDQFVIESKIKQNEKYQSVDEMKYYFLLWANASHSVTRSRLIRKIIDLRCQTGNINFCYISLKIYLSMALAVDVKLLWKLPCDMLKSTAKFILRRIR